MKSFFKGFIVILFVLFSNQIIAQTLTITPSTISIGNYNVAIIDTNLLAFQVSGSNLTPAADSIIITAPAGSAVSTSWNSSFKSSVKIGYSGSSLTATTVFVKVFPLTAAAYNQSIAISGGGSAVKNLLITGGVTLNWHKPSNGGSWSSVGWQSTTDGGITWVNASVPTGTENIFLPDNITITIDSTLSLNLSGYVKAHGILTALGVSLKPLTFTGGTYEHAQNSGVVPTATWGTGSTLLITGVTSTNPSSPPSGQVYNNFIWNCPAQTTNLNLGWNNVTVNGDLICLASGPNAAYQFRLTSAATLRTINILGNVIVDGGYLTASGSSGAAYYIINVNKNLNIKSGKLNLCAGSGGKATWNLRGDLNISTDGNFSKASNTTDSTKIVFMGGSTQYYYNTGTNAHINYGVDNGTTVILNSPLSIGGTSSSAPGYLDLTSGKFVTTSTNIITLTNYCVLNGNNIAGTGYIDGPLAITISSATAVKTFPIGKGSVSRPLVLNLTQSEAKSTTYTAEMFNAAPQSRTLPVGLDSVSKIRFYRLIKSSGADAISPTSIQLSYGVDDKITDSTAIRVAMDDTSGHWINIGGSGKGTTQGYILSDAFSSITKNDFVIAHKDPTVPTVLATLSTSPIKNLSTISAVSGGNITNSGNDAITARGVCWNTAANPTTANNKTSDGAGGGTFISAITGLEAGKTYYLRAYAINSAGTAYGNEISFTTLSSLSVPTVTTDSIGDIINTNAMAYGNVAFWGGSTIIAQGICWSTSRNPTIADSNMMNFSVTAGEGKFSVPIGGLNLGTTYYVRAFATNSIGTAYGNELSFKTPQAQPDVVKTVALDGSGNYRTVQAAFDAVPKNYTGKWIIKIKNGIYYEKILLESGKVNVVLIGESRDGTILTYDDYAGKSPSSSGTSTSYSVAIDASDFQAQNITFRNTATTAQAVALRINGDRQVYYNCAMRGFQDTYYTQGGSTGPDRIYNKKCYIEGSVDFIFGRDVAVFDSCVIFCNRNGGVLTAAATEPGFKFGYVFLNDTIKSLAAGEVGFDGNPMVSFYLGRPWQSSPKTVFINCYEPATLNAAGWTTMGPDAVLFAEYNCKGPGSSTNRSKIWTATNQPSQLSATEAETYTIANIFSKFTAAAPFSYSASWTPVILDIPYKSTGIKDDKTRLPDTYELMNNYPNPFNPSTNIRYAIPNISKVTIKIYSSIGQEVNTLVNGIQQPGFHEIMWNGNNKDGYKVSSGLYLLRIFAEPLSGGNSFSYTQKLMLMK